MASSATPTKVRTWAIATIEILGRLRGRLCVCVGEKENFGLSNVEQLVIGVLTVFLLCSYLTRLRFPKASFLRCLSTYDWNKLILIGCFGRRKLLPKSAFPESCPAAL